MNPKKENLHEKLDWNVIQTEMKKKIGTDIFDSWLKKIEFIEEFNNYVLLSVTTRFIRDWITSRYLDQILQIIKVYKKDINRIELTINEKKESSGNIQSNHKGSEETNASVSFIKDSYLQYNRIDPNKKLDNFILGPSNKLAYEASKKVSEDVSHYNPLYIYGGVGMGKNSSFKCHWTKIKRKK